MKRIIYFFASVLLIATSCSKSSENNSGSLILTGIKTSKGSELVSIEPDSGIIGSTPIDGYLLGSTVFDKTTKSYGYVNTDSVFKLVNPITGTINKSIKLPGFLSQAVIDDNDHTLIGVCLKITYGDEPDTLDTKISKAGPMIYTSYILRVDLGTGLILSENQIDLGDGAFACSYFYNSDTKEYFLIRSDYNLISVNPATGRINRTISFGKVLNNIIYNQDNNTIIGVSYSSVSNKNHLEVYDLNTCSMISDHELDQIDYYIACVSGFDRDLNAYILLNNSQEVLFIDISTGKTIKTSKLDVPLNDIKFWKR